MLAIEYTITLKSPLRIATGTGQAGWLDGTAMRDTEGHPYVPAGSIKGRCRAHAFRLAAPLGMVTHDADQETAGCPITADPCPICRTFGAAQWPAALYFSDVALDSLLRQLLLSLDDTARAARRRPQAGKTFGRGVRANTAIDRRTRTAYPGHLFTHEVIGPSVSFTGRVEGAIRNPDPNHSETALLVAALESITHLGGAKGRGTGRCLVTVETITIDGTDVGRAELLGRLFAAGEPS